MSEKNKQNTDTASNRRDFLKLAALSAATGGAVLASTNDSEASEVMSLTSAGYRETDHVRQFYKSARF